MQHPLHAQMWYNRRLTLRMSCAESASEASHGRDDGMQRARRRKVEAAQTDNTDGDVVRQPTFTC